MTVQPTNTTAGKREGDIERLAETLRAGARWHEREAYALRQLAEKMEHPPEGVRVECHGYPHPRVVFVGPPVIPVPRAARP